MKNVAKFLGQEFKNNMTNESRLISLVYKRDGRIDSLNIKTSPDGTLGVYPKIDSFSFELENLLFTQTVAICFKDA